MFYIDEPCPVCTNGVVGFHRCSDGSTIVFLCTECGTVWDNPDITQSDPVVFFNTPDPELPGANCSLGGDISGWASLEEIKRAKLEGLVAGEAEDHVC